MLVVGTAVGIAAAGCSVMGLATEGDDTAQTVGKVLMSAGIIMTVGSIVGGSVLMNST